MKNQSRLPIALLCSAVAIVLIGSAFAIRNANRLRANSKLVVVRFAPDSNTIAVGTVQGTIELWDLSERKRTHDWVAHKRGMQSLAFSPDGKLLASHGRDRQARLWQIDPLQQRLEIQDPTGSGVTAEPRWANSEIAFSPDGRLLAVFGFFWDVQSGGKRATYGTRGAVSISSNRLVSRSRRGFRVRDIKFLTPLLEVKDDALPCFAISPDDQFVAIGRSAFDVGVLLYSIPDGKKVHSFPEISSWVYSIAFSPDSEEIAIACERDHIRIYRTGTWELTKTIVTKGTENYSVDYSPNGKYLAAVGTNAAIRVWSRPDYSRID